MQVGNPADFLGAKKSLDSASLRAVMGGGLTYDVHWESPREWSRLEGFSGGHLVQPPALAGPPRAAYAGPWTEPFRVCPRKETPQFLWATCACALSPTWHSEAAICISIRTPCLFSCRTVSSFPSAFPPVWVVHSLELNQSILLTLWWSLLSISLHFFVKCFQNVLSKIFEVFVKSQITEIVKKIKLGSTS